MDYGALITALITLGTGIASAIMKDDTLTDEQKKVYIDRIQKAMDSVPEWK